MAVRCANAGAVVPPISRPAMNVSGDRNQLSRAQTDRARHGVGRFHRRRRRVRLIAKGEHLEDVPRGRRRDRGRAGVGGPRGVAVVRGRQPREMKDRGEAGGHIFASAKIGPQPAACILGDAAAARSARAVTNPLVTRPPTWYADAVTLPALPGQATTSTARTYRATRIGAGRADRPKRPYMLPGGRGCRPAAASGPSSGPASRPRLLCSHTW